MERKKADYKRTLVGPRRKSGREQTNKNYVRTSDEENKAKIQRDNIGENTQEIGVTNWSKKIREEWRRTLSVAVSLNGWKTREEEEEMCTIILC